MSEKLNAKIHVLLGGEEQITAPFGKRRRGAKDAQHLFGGNP